MDSGAGAGVVGEIDLGHGFSRVFTDKTLRLFRISAEAAFVLGAEDSRFLALLGMTKLHEDLSVRIRG